MHGKDIGCTPPNKIPYTTMVTFRDIIDTWKVSIYMHGKDIGCTPQDKIPYSTKVTFR